MLDDEDALCRADFCVFSKQKMPSLGHVAG